MTGWVNILSTFLGAAIGAHFALWYDGWLVRRAVLANVLDLQRRVAALEHYVATQKQETNG